MKRIAKTYGILALIVGMIVLFDQITKAIVRANLPFGASWMPFPGIAPFIRIVHWQNTGAAFGVFQGGGLIFSILAVIVSAVIVIYFPQIPNEYLIMRIALAMQMGGAIGNLIDRIRFGPVTDFIAVGAFPVFNIADASITVGVTVLLIFLWVLERKGKDDALDVVDQPPDQNPDSSLDQTS